MTILDYVTKELKNIKEKPPKERWAYFLDYYKWHALALLLVIVLLIQGVVSLTTQKDTALSGIILNCKLGIDDTSFLQNFYDYAKIDANKESAAFYTDLTFSNGQSQHDTSTFQRIMAGIATKETDFIAGKPEHFRICAYNSNNIFMDLRQFLDEATLAQLSEKFYYIDGDIIEQLNAPVGSEVDISALQYPDPLKPELMKNPIPVGINISNCEAFQSAYYLSQTTLYIGVVANTTRPDTVRLLINYLIT